jgi:MFS family permease
MRVGISRATLGPVFSASLVGFLVGAPFFGYVGDRFGRRVAIISSLIIVGLTTLACAWASGVKAVARISAGSAPNDHTERLLPTREHG